MLRLIAAQRRGVGKVRATTPHGTYTFEITAVEVDDEARVATLRLAEVER